MKIVRKTLTNLAAIVALTQSSLAIAKNHNEHHDENPMKKLAITACATHSEGEQVKLEHPIWGQVNAICVKSPHKDQLIAMAPKIVEHIKSSQKACAGKAEGEKVSITSIHNSDQKIDAICQGKNGVLSAQPARNKQKNHKKQASN